jgi:hypothetical protein
MPLSSFKKVGSASGADEGEPSDRRQCPGSDRSRQAVKGDTSHASPITFSFSAVAGILGASRTARSNNRAQAATTCSQLRGGVRLRLQIVCERIQRRTAVFLNINTVAIACGISVGLVSGAKSTNHTPSGKVAARQRSSMARRFYHITCAGQRDKTCSHCRYIVPGK